MLHEFLEQHRQWLLDRCRVLRSARSLVANDSRADTGLSIFVDQLVESLKIEQLRGLDASASVAGPSSGIPSHSAIGATALDQGSRLQSLGVGIDDLVHSYGDLCHAIVDLAMLEKATLSVAEYRMLNHCLDNAI